MKLFKSEIKDKLAKVILLLGILLRINSAIGAIVVWGDTTTFDQADVPAGLTNVVAIAAEGDYSLALTGEGRVEGWSSLYGPGAVPSGLSNIVAIAAGQSHALALRSDGTVVSWGTLTNVPLGLTNVVSIAAGDVHSLALKIDGTLVAWGDNSYGQATVPPELTNVVAISAGWYHNLALRKDGTVVNWGDNSLGETSIPLGLAGIAQISAGAETSFALKSDGTVVSWGYISQPQLSNTVEVVGAGGHALASKMDNTVAAWGSDFFGESDVPQGLTNVVAIAGGYRHSLALTGSPTELPFEGSLFLIPQPKTTQDQGMHSFAAAIGANIQIMASGVPVWPTTYQWQFAGQDLSGETGAALTLTNLQMANQGLYSLRVSNCFSSELVCDAELSVLPLLITVEPQSQTVLVGSNVVFTVASEGHGPFTYQWRLNGTDIVGANDSTFDIPSVSLGQAGVYSVAISNQYGLVVSSNATLVVAPLFITLQPNSQAALAGTNVQFTVTATGPSPLSYQWQFLYTNLVAATNPTLYLSAVSPAQSGAYSVVVGNQYGNVVSSNAVLTVLPLSISITPTNPVTFPGGTLTLNSVAAGAGPFSYQWQFQDQSIPGATNSSLSLSNIVFGFGGEYSVIGSNFYGALTSQAVNLLVSQVAVWGYDGGDQISMPTGLTNVLAVAGGNYFNLALRSDGTVGAWGDNSAGEVNVPADLTNAEAIATGYDIRCCLALKSDGTVVGWGDNVNGQLNIPPGLTNVVALAVGEAHVLALLSDGTVTGWGDNSVGQASPPPGLSNVCAIATGTYHSLALLADGTLAGWGVDFGGVPTSVPSTVTNAVAIACGPYFSLALNADGSVIGWGDNSAGQLSAPDNATNVIGIAAGWANTVALQADSSVTCWGDDYWGESNIPAGLSNVISIGTGRYTGLAIVDQDRFFELLSGPHIVVAPPLSNVAQRPMKLQALDGQPVQFFVAREGVEPSYQWFFGGDLIPGATRGSLTLTTSVPAQAGHYSVVISNFSGPARSSDVLLELVPLEVSAQPQSQFGLAGTNISLQVGVVGQGPFAYQWRRNGVDLPGAIDASLTLTNILPSQSGVYSVVISNSFGSVTSSNAILAVPPLLISGPPVDLIVFAGTNVNFTVAATGVEPFTYQWSFNGLDIEGATNASLALVDVQSANAGVFSVMVSNGYGSVNAVATLSVAPKPPVIVVQPFNQRVFLRHLASFLVAATGSEPFNYRWTHNGTDLLSATNATLILNSVQSSDAGIYTVTIDNVYGSATSSNSVLTPMLSSVVAWGNSSSLQTNVPPELTNAMALAGGSFHTLALRTDSGVAAWGDYEATDVPDGLSNVLQVAAGDLFNLALLADGTVAAWGFDVTGATAVPPDLSNVVQIAAGLSHSLALKGDGTVVAWGENIYGEAAAPAAIKTTVAIAAGGAHSLALQADGTVVSWGNDYYGQTNTPSDLTNVIQIAAGYYHSLALKQDGTVVAWGDNAYGQTAIPSGLSNVVGIAAAAGGNHSLALKADGTVVSWGDSRYGQTQVPAGLADVVDIAGGYAHSAAAFNDGSPMVVRQVPNRYTYSGKTVGLNLLVRGQPPLVCQWQFNGTNLSGATNAFLILTNVALASAGSYQCIVSNGLGAVISSPCQLDVHRSTSQFDISGLVLAPVQGFQLRIIGLSGHGPIILYSSTNLKDWIPISTNPPVLGAFQTEDSAATNFSARFYRAAEE